MTLATLYLVDRYRDELLVASDEVRVASPVSAPPPPTVRRFPFTLLPLFISIPLTSGL